MVERHVNGETLAKEIACFAEGWILGLQTKDCCTYNSANPRLASKEAREDSAKPVADASLPLELSFF